MSQTGYTPIQLYRSSTAAAAPSAGSLADGELALNTTDEKLYFKNASGTVKLLASSAGASGTVTSVAATGGTGISVAGSPITSSGTLTITNTAPDQVVSLAGAGTTTVTGTYPNFTITSNDQYAGTVTSVAASGGTTGLTFSGSPITSSGTLTLAGTLAVANGGTGATTAQQATYNIKSIYRGTGPILLAITGQSNAVGVNSGGGNPNNSLVNTWNPSTSAWVSGGQYTSAPWTSAAPTGNSSNNNFALSAAHYLADALGREVYIVFDALSGQSITEWTGSGTASTRYAALTAKIQNALATAPFTSVGKTTVDAIIWAQGEENGAGVNFMNYATYLSNLTTLDTQFRAETWMEEFTPVFIMGMSPLHDRYQISPALQNFSNKSNGTWRYLSTRSLRTEYQETGSGDYTHWLGPSLWEGGYNILGPAILNNERYSQEAPDSLFYGRGNGAATMADATAISTFSTLVSWDSRDLTASAVTSPAATGSMSWGYQCVADGNYTFALGYENTTDNLSNYTILAGRSLTSSSTGDYAAGFGYQNALNNTYTFAVGRGHTVSSTGASAVGLFSAVTTDLADPAIFQVGNGTTASNRSNALTVYKSGIVTIPTLNLTNALGVAYGGTGVTTSTGTGSVVLNTSPTLVTPTLGAASATSIANGLGAVGTPSYTFTGDTNTGIWSPAADTVAVSTAGSERMRVDSAGNVVLGHTSSLSIAGRTSLLQTYGANLYAGVRYNSASGAGANFNFARSRSATIGSFAIVNANDAIASINFSGDDGTAFVDAASIIASVDGTPGVGDMPGRLQFLTTADGASTPTERMRITNAGFVGIGTTSPSSRLSVLGHNEFSLGFSARTTSTQTSILNQPVMVLQNDSSAAGNGLGLRYQIADTGSVLRTTGGVGMVATAKDASSVTADMYFYTGTSERMRIDSSGRVGVGTSSPTSRLTIAGGIAEIRDGQPLMLRPAGNGWDMRLQATGTQLDILSGGALGSPIMSLVNGGNVGIGTSSPATKLHLLTPSATAVALRAGNSVSYAEFQVDASGNSQLVAPGGVQIFNTNGSERVRINSSGEFLVGTSSGGRTVCINASDNWIRQQNASRSWLIGPSNGTSYYIYDETAGQYRFSIDSSGNVGIGTTSITQRVTIQGNQLIIPTAGWSSGNTARLYLGDTNNGVSATNGGYLSYDSFNGHNWNVNGTEGMRIDGSRNVGIGTSSLSNRFTVKGGTSWLQNYNGSAASPTEAVDWPVPALNVTSFGDFTFQTMMAFTLPNDGNYFTGDTVWNIRLEQTASSITSSSSTGLRLMGPGYLAFGSGQQERLRFSTSGGITSSDLADAVGYKGVPQNAQTAAYTLALSDMGKHISITTGGVTIPANASVAFPIGATISIYNDSASNQTISITTDTLRQAGTANTGSRTLAQRGLATCVKVASTTWVISGAGLS